MSRGIEADAELLRLLAGLLAQPGEESAAVIGEWAAAHPWLSEAAGELGTLPLEEWQAEHTRLFVSGQPRTPCLPFASAWLHGHMNGDACAQIEGCYARLGVAPAAALPADYLGTLLECAAYMIENRMTDTPQWSELRERYLESWVGRLAEALQREAQISLYRVLGMQLADLPLQEGRR